MRTLTLLLSLLMLVAVAGCNEHIASNPAPDDLLAHPDLAVRTAPQAVYADHLYVNGLNAVEAEQEEIEVHTKGPIGVRTKRVKLTHIKSGANKSKYNGSDGDVWCHVKDDSGYETPCE